MDLGCAGLTKELGNDPFYDFFNVRKFHLWSLLNQEFALWEGLAYEFNFFVSYRTTYVPTLLMSVLEVW